VKRPPTILAVSGLVGSLAVLVVAMASTPLGSVIPVSEAATTAPRESLRRSADPQAVRLLERAENARATTAYNGVQFISAWTEQGAIGMVVEVNHRPGVGTSVHTDGNAQNPPADTYLPAENNEPSLISGSQALALLTANYELSRRGSRSVAGRATQLVEARRPHSATPAARFWIDSKTGLVLRREVFDERGRTTRASAFVEVEVGRVGGSPTTASRKHAAWPHEVTTNRFAKMRAKGWHCPERVGGSLSLVDARRGGGPRQPILHLSFSDGLSSVAVFEQRGRLEASKLEGYRSASRRGGMVYIHDGVPTRMVWAAKGMVFTVVADAPARTVNQVFSTLPRPDQESGRWGRLNRGMDRVASWFNPFG
jgi:sigma-E factor negative regulatory protein RseB